MKDVASSALLSPDYTALCPSHRCEYLNLLKSYFVFFSIGCYDWIVSTRGGAACVTGSCELTGQRIWERTRWRYAEGFESGSVTNLPNPWRQETEKDNICLIPCYRNLHVFLCCRPQAKPGNEHFNYNATDYIPNTRVSELNYCLKCDSYLFAEGFPFSLIHFTPCYFSSL
jgi:hypothetical protein